MSRKNIPKIYSKNCFKLKPLDESRGEVHLKDEVLVSFKPYPKTKQIKHHSIMPTFNSDRKYYTNAFALPSESYQQDEELKDHEARVKQAETEISDFWVPKPRNKHNICAVCRCRYQDYKEHTESSTHYEKSISNSYQNMIRELAVEVQQKTKVKSQEQSSGMEGAEGMEELESFGEDVYKYFSFDTYAGRSQCKIQNIIEFQSL